MYRIVFIMINELQICSTKVVLEYEYEYSLLEYEYEYADPEYEYEYADSEYEYEYE